MKKLLNFLFSNVTFDKYVEGMYAHEYADEQLRKEIAKNYFEKFNPLPTPYTHPEKYDPLNPPTGWAYDPYYECWIQTE